MTRNKSPVLQFFIIILIYSKVFFCHMVKVIQYKLTPEKKKGDESYCEESWVTLQPH